MEFCSWGPLHLKYFREENRRHALCLRSTGASTRALGEGELAGLQPVWVVGSGRPGWARGAVALEEVLCCQRLSAVWWGSRLPAPSYFSGQPVLSMYVHTPRKAPHLGGSCAVVRAQKASGLENPPNSARFGHLTSGR